MDVLHQIIEGLSKEEIRFYKLFAHRQQAGDDRKDLRLLDMLRKQSGDDDTLFRKLYPDGDKNAYYRLRNRLIEDINRSLHLQHYQDDELLQLLHLYTMVRLFSSKGQHSLAVHFLKKAEQKAIKAEHLELLDLIYGEFIRLSHELLIIDPEQYIRLRQENQEALRRLREMDDLLAVVSYRLKITQNFDDKENSLTAILERATSGFSQDTSLLHSARFRIKLYSLVSQMLLQKKDYPELEKYLLKTYDTFCADHIFTRNTHETRLQMLTYLVNCLFKNGKVKASLAYAEMLREAMDAFNQLHFDKYEIFYYNALVNNYSTFDIPRAIEILQQMLQARTLKKNPFYELFVYLNLATSYFDLKQYSQAIKSLSKVYLLDAWEKADASVGFRVAMAELIIRHELGDMEFWHYRRDQLLRLFSDRFQNTEHQKERELLALMEQAAPLEEKLRSRKMRPALEAYLHRWKHTEQEGEIIRYLPWIQDKLNA